MKKPPVTHFNIYSFSHKTMCNMSADGGHAAHEWTIRPQKFPYFTHRARWIELRGQKTCDDLKSPVSLKMNDRELLFYQLECRDL